MVLDYKKNPDEAIRRAVEDLKNGIPVVFPTETVYGIGCLISRPDAGEKIFEIKQRDRGKPLAAHISRIEQVEDLVEEIPPVFESLAKKYLPGPLAVIMKKKSHIPDSVTGGFDTISIRFPDNEACLRLTGAVGEPLAATSANVSGRPSTISGREAASCSEFERLTIIDDGTTKYQRESTVVSAVNGKIEILRQGVIEL